MCKTMYPGPRGFSRSGRWIKSLVTVVLNLTSMQLTAVKYVTWVITLSTNHRGVITIPPIRNKGQILTLLKSYWCGTISQLTTVSRRFLSRPRNGKKISGTLGKDNEWYQLKVDVGMLNTVEIYWSSIIPHCVQHTHVNFQLIQFIVLLVTPTQINTSSYMA